MAVLLFLLAFPILLFLYQKYRNKHGSRAMPPGPPGLPLIGNLHQLDNSSIHLDLWQLSKKHGPLMFLRLGMVPTLVVSSAKMAEEVLKTHDAEVAGRPSLLGQQRLSYNGLDVAFTPYSGYWREMRRICVHHLFGTKSAQSFRWAREDETLRMMRKISESASASKLVNLNHVLVSLTSAIICRTAFGRSHDDEDCEGNKFHDLVNDGQAVLGSLFVSDYFPFLGWIDRLSGLSSRLEKVFRELDGFYREIIDEHLDGGRAKSQQKDIIDVLLELQREESSAIHLTVDHIKAVLMNVFLAGTDTSAATLVWAMTQLVKNPRVMKRAQDEVRNMVVNKGIIDEDDLHSLPYLKAVVKETLRLYPPVPLLVPHETITKCSINGYEIGAKTTVYVNAWAIGRDEECWEMAEDFLPERFMGSSADYKGRDFQLIPFGAGRRICPAIYMGSVTVELALANLLYSFNWELPPGVKKEDIDTDTLPGVTMAKKNALCLLANKYCGHLDD